MSSAKTENFSAEDVALAERLAAMGVHVENPKRPFSGSPKGVGEIIALIAERTGRNKGNIQWDFAEACGRDRRTVQNWQSKPGSVNSKDAATIIDVSVDILCDPLNRAPDPSGEYDYLCDRFECEYYVAHALCLSGHAPAPVEASRYRLLKTVLGALEAAHRMDPDAVNDLLASVSLCLRAHQDGFGDLDAAALDKSVREVMSCGKSERGRAERIANEARERFGLQP